MEFLNIFQHYLKLKNTEKASKVGFDWDNVEQVFDKIYEELDELKVEIERKDKEKMKDELGDVLFSIVNIARFLDIDATEALEGTIKNLIRGLDMLNKTVILKNFIGKFRKTLAKCKKSH